MASNQFKVTFAGVDQNVVTLKNQPISRLDKLTDVNPLNSSNGSILIYDNTTDTYVQREFLAYDPTFGLFRIDGGEDGF